MKKILLLLTILPIYAHASIKDFIKDTSMKPHTCIATPDKDSAYIYCELDNNKKNYVLPLRWVQDNFDKNLSNPKLYITGGYYGGKPILKKYSAN